MQLIEPGHLDSTFTGYWAARIGTKMDEGWRTAYSDGSGCDNHHAAASHTTSRRADEQPITSSQYLGTLASFADAESLRRH